ncbi:MAG: amidase domain-containing protein [Rickettsia sp.]
MNTLLNSIIIKDIVSTLTTSFSASNFRYLFNKDTGLFDLVTLKNLFDSKLKNDSFKTICDFKITKLYFTHNNAFIFISITNSFSIKESNTTSISKNNLCFIFSQISKFNWIIDFIISAEHSPLLYWKLDNNKFSFSELKTSYLSSIEKYKNLISSTDNFKPTLTGVAPVIAQAKNFDFSKSIEYAETYALTYNSQFESFNDSGGDCTNFVSQALHYGGIKKTSSWKPYSNQWVRVNELHDFLIYNNLAKEFNHLTDNMSGSLIQFFHPEKKTWTHSGILTHQTEDDYLYCCHSYDKLNYPLSLTYPAIYPKARIIVPF